MTDGIIPFPGLTQASISEVPHSYGAGGSLMEIKHTHPSFTEEERREQLRGIKKLCTQLLMPVEQEERAG